MEKMCNTKSFQKSIFFANTTKLTQGQRNIVFKTEISKYKQNRAAILFTLYIVEAMIFASTWLLTFQSRIILIDTTEHGW